MSSEAEATSGVGDGGMHHSVDPESLANAAHLDQLESSEQVTDIASFQDIELPPQQNLDETGSVVESVVNQSPGDNPDSPRRAKRFYYWLPICRQYKFAVLGCTVVFILLLVAIGLSANALKQQNNEAAMSNVEDDNVDTNDFIINDAPTRPGPAPTPSIIDEDENNFDSKDVELGDPFDHTVKETTQPPRETPSPSTGYPTESIVDSTTPAPSPKPTSQPVTPFPVEVLDELSPKWYYTSHSQYQSFLESNAQDGINVNDLSSYNLAALFCNSQDKELCNYDSYCPNGRATDPHEGGPDGSIVQWSPFNSDDKNEQMDWVQVGKIPESEDGTAANNYGQCYTFSVWSNGEGGGDVTIAWGAEHRRWILCCEKDVPPKGEDMRGDEVP